MRTEHDGEQEGHGQRLTDRVDVSHGGRARLRDEDPGEQNRGRADRQVNPKHRAPVTELDQCATQHRAERHRNVHHGSPDADRTGPLHAADEHLTDDRQRNRIQDRTADSLQKSSRDQGVNVRRQAA